MIRRADERGDESRSGVLPKPTPEMLEQRQKYLDETFGMWDNPEGERIARWIQEAFRDPEPIPRIRPQ